ncbi:hypothetical protein KX729_29100 [Rhizobium sp. XQZ8]|uniref:hypothetical protein n=1 Tax=Rhizobium populisoli TaxID=2859785 RepID=UPI001CA5C423|nr:hypothetical protein [Rhizobium populisoli]MBW6425477.1 hypothetical protein [Rhizobium populisoli]
MSFKILAVTALSIGMATSAFAQSGNSNQGGGSGAATISPGTSAPKTDTQATTGAPADKTTTGSTTGGTMGNSGTMGSGGVSGSSASGSNPNCAPGTPGAGVQGAPANDTTSTNPACGK